MKVQLSSVSLSSALDAIAILVTEESLAKDAVVSLVDAALDGALRKHIAAEEWKPKKDAILSAPTFGKLKARKIYLVAVSKSDDVIAIRAACAKLARTAQSDKCKSVGLFLAAEGTHDTARAAAEGVTLGAYRFTKYFTGDRLPKSTLATVTIDARLGSDKSTKGTKATKAKPATKPTSAAQLAIAITEGVGVGGAINLVRDLVNEPPNELTPASFATRAAALCKSHNLGCKIFDKKKILAENMHLFYAVGRGSANEPRFIHMTYLPPKPRKDRKRLVVVGKGLTFDSGGISIKQAAGMGDMKSDMAGGALSMGLMAALAALRPDIEVHAIIAAAENMPDADAYRPGDIWRSLDGKTVEIINTDAEGRLVLADALTYAAKLKPDVLIDHATLTGACLVALGTSTAALYSNSDTLAASYVAAAKVSGEALWHMPLIEELRESMKSDVADIKHTGDRFGGSIIGGLFLREFIGDCKQWIHMDIAGPAFVDRATALSPKGGTGYGLLTLLSFIDTLV
ncbi:MAG: leucyl aminopeptidase [Deltaproteobacteria bacterium]|nr:leucyl aminopeptidase [Deltaproteobacteria bacterium]